LSITDYLSAHVLFSTSVHAHEAVNKLHAHVYKGCLLSVTLKKRLDTLSKPTTLPKKKGAAEDVKGKATATAPSHASRLIVRNLPFNATEQDLRAIFLPYGPIHSVHIPLDTSEEKTKPKSESTEAESSTAAATAAAYAAQKKPRTKGFAFVWMLSRKDAEKAIEGCNGMTVRAGSAESLVSAKQKKKKLVRLEKKRAEKDAAAVKGGEGKDGDAEEDAGEDEDEDEDMEKDKEGVDDKRATERIIAVDWALSKEKWKEEKAKIEEEEVDSASGSSDESSSEDDSDDDDKLGVHSGSEGEDDSDSQPGTDDDDSDGEERVKPQLPPPEKGTTLFIRNIPFEATEEELRTL
jgi:nucleolar protein 4